MHTEQTVVISAEEEKSYACTRRQKKKAEINKNQGRPVCNVAGVVGYAQATAIHHIVQRKGRRAVSDP